MQKETRLILAICLSCLFMLAEVIGGYLANSIAIFSDAAHLLTDIAGFGIALIATIAAKSPGTKTLTFGMARAEVFGALGSILSLWVITIFLLYAAFMRAVAWFEGVPENVDGRLMFFIACFGVVVNVCLGLVFHDDHGGSLHPAHSHDHAHGGPHHDEHSVAEDQNNGHSHSHAGAAGSSGYQTVASDDVEMGTRSTVTAQSNAHHHDHKQSGYISTPESSSSKKQTDREVNSSTKNTTPMPAIAPGPIKSSKDLASRLQKAPKTPSQSDVPSAVVMGERKDEKTGLLSGIASSSYGAESILDKSSGIAHSHSAHGHDHAEATSHHHDHGHGHEHSDHIASNDKQHKSSHQHDHSHHHAHGGDVNIEAAYLHVLTDLIQSIGVAIAGLVLLFMPHWQIIDPICTVIFSFVALKSTIPLMSRVFMILFDGTPSSVDWEIVISKFESLPGVHDVHDLHIWSISSNSISLTCHMRSSNPQQTLMEAHNICRQMHIDHATIQVHDSCDDRYCYSQVCDDSDINAKTSMCAKAGSSGALAVAGGNGDSNGRKKTCASKA